MAAIIKKKKKTFMVLNSSNTQEYVIKTCKFLDGQNKASGTVPGQGNIFQSLVT